MAALPNHEEEESTYRPPNFNGQYYGWWKTRMHDFIMAEDSKLWDIIRDGPFVSMKTGNEDSCLWHRPDEYNRISACQSAKEIWEALQTAHEGTTQVKQSKIDMLTTEYEIFKMKEDESIQDMHTCFTSIINELHSLGEVIPRNKLVWKILSILPGFWESKVNAIIEAKDLQKLTIDELIGNLKTYEMKRKKDLERREPKKEKNLVLKAANKDSSSDESDMECGKSGHFIKDYPLHKQDHYKTSTKKATKSNQVPDKKFKRRDVANNMLKQALVDWGNSSSESEGENMMVADNGSSEYESIFALMAKSDDDEDNEEDEVSFLDVQRNLKTYSKKKLMSLANVLIDAYHSLINEKNSLIEEIGGIEQERDYMGVSIVDLEETIESMKKEKEVLTESNANIEHEIDDLLVVVVNLKGTIGELKMKSRTENSQKGKEVANEAHIKLESELNLVNSGMCDELDRNKQLQEELGRVKSDLEKLLKWTWSYDVITALYTNNGEIGRESGSKGKRLPTTLIASTLVYLTIGFALTVATLGTLKQIVRVIIHPFSHCKDSCKVKIQSLQNNKVFVEKRHIDEEPGSQKENMCWNSERKQPTIVHG
ncbi:intracellular protein transport protein USO1-like [Nicotiana sylvestris]|uniref:intracellular protein transport protein USO1-like n=1 Tax=Nicotiana sylvestris TaxID=4096 RepID=UPI00388C6B11